MNQPLIDSHQNFWQLASIQVASMGIAGIMIGSQIAAQYGIGNAIGAIVIGNLILWLMGLIIVSMSHPDRVNSIVNIRRCLGKGSAIWTAIMVILACTFWIVFQIDSSIHFLSSFFPNNHANSGQSFKLGAALGLIVSLLAIGGIRLIKHLNVVFLPFLFGFQTIALSIAGKNDIVGPFLSFSLPPIIIVILFNIVATATLPNFFRHSRSLADSFLALTLIALMNCFFQISSIWIDFSDLIATFQRMNFGFLSLLCVVLVLGSFCSILECIYAASASWEAIVPRFDGSKEYAIIGLAGTVSYLFIQISGPMAFIVDLACDFILILILVMLFTYLVQFVVKNKPSMFGKIVGSAAWIVGCIFATILKFQRPDQSAENLLAATGACALFFLGIVFIQELIWSLNKIRKRS